MFQYLHPSLFIREAKCEFLVKVLLYAAMARAIPILNSSGKETFKLTLTLQKIHFSLVRNVIYIN